MCNFPQSWFCSCSNVSVVVVQLTITACTEHARLTYAPMKQRSTADCDFTDKNKVVKSVPEISSNGLDIFTLQH